MDIFDLTPEEFVVKVGTGTIVHNSGDLFGDHLKAVQRVLKEWGVGKELELAGLFHSIYGTEGFQDFQLSLDRRQDVKRLVGERAEHCAYCNCVMDRETLDATLSAPAGKHTIRARPDVGGHEIVLTDQQFSDLITVHLADWLEQVEREAAKVNERHGWFKEGDAWGYRRKAYRQMAELLGGPAQDAYQAVFAREPDSTRHISQDLTPKLKAPITPKIFVQ
ncbi:g8088 [Coccomyxa elongata]